MPECQLNPPMVDRLQAQTRPFVPANTENFLNDVCRPELSLAELAKRYSTTVDALSVWLSRPDVLQRLAEIRSVSAQRAGFIAGMHLPRYAHALSTSLNQAVTESDFLGHLTLSLESNTLRVRYRENIRKTVALLTNIARFERSATRWAKPRDTKPSNPKPVQPPSAPRPGSDSISPRHTEPHHNREALSRKSVPVPAHLPASLHSPAPNRAPRDIPHSQPAPHQCAAPGQGKKPNKRAKRNHNSPLIRSAASPRPPTSQSPSRKARTSSIPKAKPTSAPQFASPRTRTAATNNTQSRPRRNNIRQPGQKARARTSRSLPGPAP